MKALISLVVIVGIGSVAIVGGLGIGAVIKKCGAFLGTIIVGAAVLTVLIVLHDLVSNQRGRGKPP